MWIRGIVVYLALMLESRYWGKCRNFAQLREGSDDPPPPVPSSVAGALASATLDPLVAVSAAANPQIARLAGRITANSRLTALIGRLGMFVC